MFFPMKRQNRGTIFASFLGAVWLTVLLVLGRWLAAADRVSAHNFCILKNAKNLKKPTFSKGNWKSNGKISVAFSVIFSNRWVRTFQVHVPLAKWGRSKFCKMQIGDGAMPCVCRLQRPAHGPKFARISECRLLSLRHFVPPPSSDGGFFTACRGRHALRLSYIGFASYIAYGNYICLTPSDIAHFVRSWGYNLDRNSP